MEFKEIYSFNIYEKKEKTVETESQDENGNSVTIKKKVTEDSPIKVILRKPSRRQIEEAELEYSVEMSRCVKKGILTKAMLVKKYSDSGGLMSETEAKNLYTLYQELFDAQKEYTEAQALDQESEKAKEASAKIVRLRDQIVKIEMTKKHGLIVKIKPCESFENFVLNVYVKTFLQDFLVFFDFFSCFSSSGNSSETL